MKVSTKINNKTLVVVDDVRYEWNDFTQSYWAVCKVNEKRTMVPARELQEEDLK